MLIRYTETGHFFVFDDVVIYSNNGYHRYHLKVRTTFLDHGHILVKAVVRHTMVYRQDVYSVWKPVDRYCITTRLSRAEIGWEICSIKSPHFP